MINTIKHLSFVLKVDVKELNMILNNPEKYYREKIIVKTDKFGNPKLNSNGEPKVRIINPSINRLKVIQKRIQRNILSNIEIPDYAYGAIKGRDNILNAEKHKGKKYKFTTDLKDYFPSITNRAVNDMFIHEGFSPTVAKALTQLTTYKGKIPQGAPTSSVVANLVFKKTGNVLYSFSTENNITFTSFVDDLTFSSAKDFHQHVPYLLFIITQNFKISHNKTNYSRNPNVTGLHPMNNHLKLPDSFIEKLNDTNGKSQKQIEGLLRYKKRVNQMSYGVIKKANS